MHTDDFQIKHIRHATMLLTVHGKRILVDPMLAEALTMKPSRLMKNPAPFPLTELPVSAESLKDVDAVLLTHLHFDHFDETAQNILPKDLPVFCQPGDAAKLQELGFVRAIPVETSQKWEGLTLHRVEGNHGTGVARKLMGNSSGFVLEYGVGQHTYLGGDAIYDELFAENLRRFKPQNIVLYAGEARLKMGNPITMGSADVVSVCTQAPEARIVAVHMEALPHCALTRVQLRSDLERAGMPGRVEIPDDGEVVVL